MPTGMRPAIASALPRAVVFKAGSERLPRWFATAVTVLTAAVGIVVAAIVAVVLGMT